MGRKKPDKNQNNGQVKYADPREAYLSTKKEMVVVENTNLKMSSLFTNTINDSVVIAEDQKGFYATGKSYVGALTLDPYRSYANTRNNVIVTKTDSGFDISSVSNGMMFSVTI
jgi:hypothetical protein